MGLYFSWILSFPYFGSLLKTVSASFGLDPNFLTFSFLLLHALGFLIGANFLKNINQWKHLMLGSLVAVLLLSISLIFAPTRLWPSLMAAIGFFSPFYILGWSCLISTYPSNQKLRLYLNFIIRANLITIFLIYLSYVLNPDFLHYIILIPLITAFFVLLFMSPEGIITIKINNETEKKLSTLYIAVMVLFVTLLNITLGFFFTVVHDSYPVLTRYGLILNYYYFIPYILTYILIISFKLKLKKKDMIYYASSLIGLAYIIFIIIDNSLVGYYLTITVMQIAQALVALFIWLLIGDLSTRYGTPFRFFGFGLFAIILGSYIGGFFGDYLLELSDSPQLISALVSITAIFLSFFVAPWLIDQSEPKTQDSGNLLTSDQDYLETFYSTAGLTTREREIVGLLMQGYNNETTSRTLGISENTVKTHLRNIYQKYGVRKRSELLALIATKKLPSV